MDVEILTGVVNPHGVGARLCTSNCSLALECRVQLTAAVLSVLDTSTVMMNDYQLQRADKASNCYSRYTIIQQPI